jgi:hypothetical protein
MCTDDDDDDNEEEEEEEDVDDGSYDKPDIDKPNGCCNCCKNICFCAVSRPELDAKEEQAEENDKLVEQVIFALIFGAKDEDTFERVFESITMVFLL